MTVSDHDPRSAKTTARRERRAAQRREFAEWRRWTTAAGRRRCRICNRERHRLERERRRAA